VEDTRINLLDLSFVELTELVVEWGLPRFRAAQIWKWLYASLCDEMTEMTNLPKDLIALLQERAYVGTLEAADRLVSEEDNTEKVLFQARDGELFEAVLMRYTSRNSVCVSSQVGCPVGCLFCATGQRGFSRDLTAGEISAQVLYFARALREQGQEVTNVVVMGMGEPLLNFEAVWKSLENLNDREGMNLGARRFTVSTSGIVPGIERMAQESFSAGLAVSLHSPRDEVRNRLVPVNRRYPVARLLEAIQFYIERTGRRVTFEYALLEGINDSEADAKMMASLLRGMLCHVNLIPVNPTQGCGYEPSTRQVADMFRNELERAGIQTTVRVRRGIDIGAGCGQLRGGYEAGARGLAEQATESGSA